MNATRYTIEPLDWKGNEFQQVALTVLGDARVAIMNGGFHWVFSQYMTWQKCDSLADGQARCEAMFRRMLIERHLKEFKDAS